MLDAKLDPTLDTAMPPATPAEAHRAAIHAFLLATPLYALVPVGFWLAFRLFGVPLSWAAFGLGAAGWTLALMLRGPVGVLVKGLPKERASAWMVGVSGPFEEGVRLVALLVTGTSLRWAASLGQGWAAVEVVFAVVNALVVLSMAQRTDAKGMEVRDLLERSGGLQTNPLLGVIERVSASAFHIGSTLLIASHPWLVLAMAPVHSGFNVAAVRLAKRSATRAEVFLAVVGLAVLLAGLLVFAVLAPARAR